MTEFELKRRFVETDLTHLLCSIDTRIIGVEYIGSEVLETVYVRMSNGKKYIVDVTGDSTLYIAIDVMTALFGRSRLQSTAQNDGSEEDKPDEA